MSTPEEAYFGKRPDISHLRIFGSNVYMHVMKDARKNLEPIVEVGIFVGYTDTPPQLSCVFSRQWQDCCAARYKILGGESHEVFA